jgi:ATP-dependent DNA helicase RecG
MKVEEVLDKIEKPIRLEMRSGFKDRAAVGGLEGYVKGWVDKALRSELEDQTRSMLERLRGLVEGYSGLGFEGRRSSLQKAVELIERIRAKGREAESQPLLFDWREALDRDHGDERREIEISFPPTDEDPSMLESLMKPISSVKRIGPKRSGLLASQLGITSILDMLEYFPVGYLDRSRIKRIYDVGRSGEPETIQGRVVNKTEFFSKKSGQRIVKVTLCDDTGFAALVGFGKYGEFLGRALKVGDQLVVSGRFKRAFNEIQTSDFEFELLSEEEAELIHTGRIVPKYRLASPITQRNMRYMMRLTLDQFLSLVPEHLPLEMRRRLRLMDRRSAISNAHFPESEEHMRQARRRLIFDELFLIQLGLALRRRQVESERGISFATGGPLLRSFLESLPFELTDAQRRVIEEIRSDMAKPHPMNRLIQGDVGSGKTVVAAAALTIAVENGYQGAMMAPTEILALQHFNTLRQLLDPLGVRVVMLRGEMRGSERKAALEAIRSGEAQVIVGTHALIQEGVEFHRLGLAITDEQHRFGVLQRAALKGKGISPDVLVMTATPIPRTLALTVYGDLDLSIIDELPPGRRKVKTYWVPEEKREHMYEFIRREILAGRQAYVVYPLVEESEKLEDVKAATEMAEYLGSEVFPDLRVGLLHGRLRPHEKEEVMELFKRGKIDILVSTTVVEVGVDVPNASVMVVEHAERFGLAQLHQLRGRVGRSAHQSYCFLIADPKGEEARRRVEVMVGTNDGFEIAEADMEIRGPGELMGTRQSGMPDLKLANLVRDADLLLLARDEARRLAEADPELRTSEHRMLREIIRRVWRENLEMLSIG